MNGDINVKVFFLPIITVALLVGCSTTTSDNTSNILSDTATQTNDEVEPDVQAALDNMKAVGYKLEDFGSDASFNSAAKMVAELGAEWQMFNLWTEDLLDPRNQKKALDSIRIANDKRRKEARTINFSKKERYSEKADLAMKYSFSDCFDDSGQLHSSDAYINRYARSNVASFGIQAELYERCLINGGVECTENGQELDLESFLVKYNKTAPENMKALAFNQYYERCSVPTPVSSVHYTISAHDNDVIGSLIAASAPRVGWEYALKMAHDLVDIQSRSGVMNMIASNFYNYQRSGYFDAFDIRPFRISRANVISVMHVGGMCAAFGAETIAGNNNDSGIEIDEIAIALGAQPRQRDRGYHCLNWTDGNWKRVADYVAGESEGLRRFMSVYSPAFNSYSVPYWSYPGPYQNYSIFQTRNLKKGSGVASYTERVREKETCSTYAASHSSLATWSYPACDYLEKASLSMRNKESMMQAAGRLDAYICSSAEAENGYGQPDLSRCPTVFTRKQIEAGEHKY
ncbi:hypothetical protein BS007_RS01775 [Vibrio parahaemolyticus]|nr:hypothetical protein [Vibrio parahaemolyticus]EJG2226767.1 hypothetical protein [Vibrio parahaemolyticus]TOB18032.1 hypothetical protein CGK10_11780 [Vibrio parahaemolyticus]HBH7869798.1 hypothetical protein [Vibrio parahaemolyticus]